MATTKVNSEFIAVNAISGTIIADGAITSTHLAANCVDSSELVTGSIDTIHIAANQVTSAKIVSNGVLTRHISDDQVTGDKLTNNITIAGTLTSTGAFTSPGIDDNADAIAITIDSSENVGIGTTSPDRKLDVSGTGNVYGKFQSTNATGAGIEVKDTGEDWLIQADDGTGSGGLAFYDLGRTAYRMFLDASGNLGIGTTSPSQKLDVNGTVELNNLTVGGAQGSDGQVLTSTGSGVAWEDVSGGVAGISTSADATAITIDSSERVGIGHAAPVHKLHVFDSTTAASNTHPELAVGLQTTGIKTHAIMQFWSSDAGTIHFGDAASPWDGYISYGHSNQSLDFGVNGATKMSLMQTSQSNGALRIGTTSPLASSNEKMSIKGSAGLTIKTTDYYDYAPLYLWQDAANATNSTTNLYVGITSHNDVRVGSITSVGSTTSYNTTSDYRLKENVSYDWDATTRLKQLKPAKFNFILDADKTIDGFLAHEVSSVVPEAITGEKDAMKDEEYEVTAEKLDEDGNVIAEAVRGIRTVPDYQCIDQAKLVPLLVKTIQELEARITTLEG